MSFSPWPASATAPPTAWRKRMMIKLAKSTRKIPEPTTRLQMEIKSFLYLSLLPSAFSRTPGRLRSPIASRRNVNLNIYYKWRATNVWGWNCNLSLALCEPVLLDHYRQNKNWCRAAVMRMNTIFSRLQKGVSAGRWGSIDMDLWLMGLRLYDLNWIRHCYFVLGIFEVVICGVANRTLIWNCLCLADDWSWRSRH